MEANLRKEATDSEVLAAVTEMLETRIPTIGAQGLRKLEGECSAEGQARLKGFPHHQRGTTERWAWHAGYATAMEDTMRMFRERAATYPIPDED